MDIADSIRGQGNMDWIIDPTERMLYVQTYRDGTSESATGLVYMQFALPPITEDKEIVISEKQIIKRVEFPMIYITQDKVIHRGKLYVLSGWGENHPGMITVINLKEFQIHSTWDLSYRNDEPEGLNFYKDNLILFYWSKNYSIQNRKSLFFYFRNGISLSYPISDIKNIMYY